MIKDSIGKYLSGDNGKLMPTNEGNGQDLVGILFDMLPISELSELKNKVFDADFVSIMKDADLVQSVDALFENNLNLSETSKKTFLHRNTLLYRLDKIKKLTGFDLKNFSDAMSFKLLMLIYYRFN